MTSCATNGEVAHCASHLSPAAAPCGGLVGERCPTVAIPLWLLRSGLVDDDDAAPPPPPGAPPVALVVVVVVVVVIVDFLGEAPPPPPEVVGAPPLTEARAASCRSRCSALFAGREG